MKHKQDRPSRTYECIADEITYFAGAHAGPGPFACEFCGATLTLRPEGAEPYAGGAAVTENGADVAQMELALC